MNFLRNRPKLKMEPTMKLQDFPVDTQTDQPQIAPDVFARNVLTLLQKSPARYKTFGIWWWPVKAILRHHYGPDTLYLLGRYEDRDGAARVPRLSLQDTLARAIEEHRRNSLEGRLDGRVTDTDGEPYLLYDEDAGQ